MVWVAAGYLRLGRLDEAEIFVQRGLELAAESKDKGSRAWLLAIMGEIEAQRQSMNPTEAAVGYEEALKIGSGVENAALGSALSSWTGNSAYTRRKFHQREFRVRRCRKTLSSHVDVLVAGGCRSSP